MRAMLNGVLKGRVAVLGFGNRLWRDDGVGSVLAERLAQAQPGAPVFDGGMVPENHLERIAKATPNTVLLVDAVDFGGQPGEVRCFSGDELALAGLSTHAGSPRMLAAYLEARTGAIVTLLAIQPGDVSSGHELSGPVEAAISQVIEALGKRGLCRDDSDPANHA
ncbi:MAG: hydrogenase maturation protease [Gammaproteobacteria bacterium]|nr:hydrogenase maturation protease [Gammaproteobacteria bacterium]